MKPKIKTTCTKLQLQLLSFCLLCLSGKTRCDGNGAAPKPSIEHLDETDNWALLQCEVHGNPQPKVEWRDSAGNKLPAQEPQFTQVDGRFYVTLNTIVTKTDRYRCVATQKDISHQIYTETIVRLNVTGNSGSGAHSSGSSTAWIVAGVLCTVVGGPLAFWFQKKKTPNNGSPADPKEGSAVPLKSQPSQSQEAPDPETKLSLHVLQSLRLNDVNCVNVNSVRSSLSTPAL